jgi:hypothetical protein
MTVKMSRHDGKKSFFLFFRDFFILNFDCRVPDKKTLGKAAFADTFFGVWALPSAALGKARVSGSVRIRVEFH